MIFVIGPLFSGKQDYIMQALGWSETDFLEKAVRDVQNLAAEAAEAVETSHSPLDDLQEKLRSLADRLSQKEVVIATETGCGVIPLDPRRQGLLRNSAGAEMIRLLRPGIKSLRPLLKRRGAVYKLHIYHNIP